MHLALKRFHPKQPHLLAVASSEVAVLVSWSQLAEKCDLPRLGVHCTRQLAIALATEHSHPHYDSYGRSRVSISSSSKSTAVQAVADVAPLKVSLFSVCFCQNNTM